MVSAKLTFFAENPSPGYSLDPHIHARLPLAVLIAVSSLD